jgi:glycosyltransferase involved in cell wall biosynthesis
MNRIILSVINDLVTDQRVHRVAATLMNHGANVTLIGRKLPDSLPLERAYSTIRMKLFFKKTALFYAEYNIRLFFLLLGKKVDILVANDLDTLPANFLVSVIRRKPLMYDSHEYFTGMPEVISRKFVYHTWKCLERFIFPKLKYIYTVNHSIAQLYKEEYGKEIHVIRNVPRRIVKENWPGRKALGLPEDKKIILIQGAWINIHRGAEESVQAMCHLQGIILLIIGGGAVWEDLKKIARECHITDKIIFKPRMPYEELMAYTRLADIGLSLDKDTNINYRFSLPNKLFDYIQAEIPVLCSNLIEVANIVNTRQIGMVTESHDPVCLAEKIRDMFSDQQRLQQWKQNLAKAATELCWEKEETELVNIYKNLL